MGFFSKTDEEKLNEFKNEGYKCEAVIGSVGRSGATRAAATFFFGICGFSGNNGTKGRKSKGPTFYER